MEKILGKRQWKSRTDEIIEINRKEEADRKVKAIEASTPEKENSRGSLPLPEDSDDSDDAGTPPPFNK